jgi:hypothetical protein
MPVLVNGRRALALLYATANAVLLLGALCHRCGRHMGFCKAMCAIRMLSGLRSECE